MGGGGGGGTSSFGKSSGGGQGGGGSGGSGGGSGGTNKCEHLDEFTDLLSPKPEVVKHLKRGSKLTLAMLRGKPPILVQTPDGETAGSVVPLVLEILVQCMKEGREFTAEVVSLAGGACKLHIYPRGK
jgi:hypothetical protein